MGSTTFCEILVCRSTIPLPYAFLVSQGKYAEAELLNERSQTIRESVLGPEHPDVGNSLKNRAKLFESQVRDVICSLGISAPVRLL